MHLAGAIQRHTHVDALRQFCSKCIKDDEPANTVVGITSGLRDSSEKAVRNARLGALFLWTVNSGRKFPIVPVENSPTQNGASPTNGRRPSGRGEVQRLPFFHIG